MGSERKSHYIDPKEKLLTAYHEGGHALVAIYTEGAMPLHKVTCVPRGHALGVVSPVTYSLTTEASAAMTSAFLSPLSRSTPGLPSQLSRSLPLLPPLPSYLLTKHGPTDVPASRK